MSNQAVMETNEQDTKGQGGPMQRALNPIERLTHFLRDTRSEMSKVTTPSRAEVQSTTIVVIVAVFLFAGYFALVDFVIGNSLDKWFVHMTKR